MLKQLIFVLSLVLLVGGVSFFPEPEALGASCFSGWSKTVQRKAGNTSYPSTCLMPVCRPASAFAHGHAVKQTQICLISGCSMITSFHYDYVLGISPTNACPTDVVNASWTTTDN